MTTRKRKQPDKKTKGKAKPAGPGLALRTLTFAGRLAVRNPGVFGGSAAFAVVFSFVAANAIWYQPSAHPSPFLRTRLPFTHPQAANLEQTTDGVAPRKVTTFVIKREGEADDAETPPQTQDAQQTPETPETRQMAARPAPVPPATPQDETADLIRAVGTEVPPAPSASLVASIQKELARRGLYDGPADGQTGPKTESAILRFEKLENRQKTGIASPNVLAALRETRTGSVASAKPVQRPYENVKAGKGDLDPVAAAIRQSSIDPTYIPKADIPAASAMVMNIQKGLTNLAYAEVTVDGVAGEQTRSAIRHFEKHYRLPETGEPSEKVLKKMKEIGAL